MRAIIVPILALWLVGCDRTITINTPTTPTPTAPTTPTPTAPTAAPVITLFAADAQRIVFPAPTLLHWQVDDAKADVRIDPAPGNVPAVGSAVIYPPAVGQVFYILTAKNAAGTTQRFVTIQVTAF